MQRKHSPALRANFKASTSFPQSGTELGDIFICGTAKACSVKDCFKRSTHFHCSLCPDRKVVKEQNMVAHQIFHVTGRIEKRCVRDTHFDAYNGQCGRPLCRFAMNNKKHHHCKLCEWPCCGRKLQRCVGHMKSKHPEVSLEGFGDMTVSANSGSPKQEFDDSLNSHETDMEEKEYMNIKEESKDFNSTIEGGYNDEKIGDASEMIELRSMVWHHPLPRKITVEKSIQGKGDEVNGTHEEKVLVEKTPCPDEIEPKIENDTFQEESDFNLDKSTYEDGVEMQMGNLNESSNQNAGELAAEPSPSSYSGSTCRVNKCKEMKSHFHCHLCDFIAYKKVLLERHRNIHARGFIEKRKKRDMYFNGSDAACGVAGCRFSIVKQRHHHCKLCGWACSSRKLQRCIKHIQDKHGVSIESEPTDESHFESPRVIADPEMLPSPTFYRPGMDDGSQEGSVNGDVSESFEAGNAKGENESNSPDQFPVDIIPPGDVPNEDELFFFSKAEYRCVVEKCALLGPHYHCNRCPYVTRQKHCRGRHRAIHLKGFPERRMIRDQHFTVYDGICGRTCRFSVPKRKHFHCKYCDWACCARKLPRILNHLSRKHSEVLKDSNVTTPSAGSKRPRSYHSEPGSEGGNEENKVIILEEEGNQCSFVIKDVHSLRDSNANGDEHSHSAGERKTHADQNNHCDSQFERCRESPMNERGFKPYKPPQYTYPHGYVNGHSSQVHSVERPLTCRVCNAFASENLSVQKMVVYSSSNRLELDLRLTSLLCTYFRVSIEEAFNNYICERDFEEWCNFHARKIAVYPVIAIESTNIHHPNIIQSDEHYVQY